MTAVAEPVQLLAYRFAPGAVLEGHLVGALERLEAGGALRVLDVLVVRAEGEAGELAAVSRHGGVAGGLIAALAGMRLDASSRRQETRRALARHGDLIARLGETLRPGEAFAAVLIGHAWFRNLAGAAERSGGSELANAMVEATALGELTSALLAAATRPA